MSKSFFIPMASIPWNRVPKRGTGNHFGSKQAALARAAEYVAGREVDVVPIYEEVEYDDDDDLGLVLRAAAVANEPRGYESLQRLLANAFSTGASPTGVLVVPVEVPFGT